MRVTDWRESMAILPARARAALRALQPQRAFLGLDIGADRVRLAEIEPDRDGYVVTRLAETPMLVGGTLGNALTELVRISGSKTRRVATAVPGADVISKRVVITLPRGGDFEAAIRSEAASCIPEDLSNVNLDYQVLATLDGGRKIEVLLVAARTEIVANRVAALRAAGLKPMVVDIDSFALGNAFEMNHDLPLHCTAVLVHLGDRRITMNVVQAKRSLLAVDVPISPLPDNLVDSEPDWMADLVDEIHHAVSFYWPLAGDSPTTLYLSGAPACIPTLQSHLRERMQTTVELLDPFAKLRLATTLDDSPVRAQAPAYTLAVGLALRGFGES